MKRAAAPVLPAASAYCTMETRSEHSALPPGVLSDAVFRYIRVAYVKGE